MRQRDLFKRYHWDLFFGLLIYTALLVPTLRYAPQMPAGWLATAVHLCPMLGFVLILRGMLRWYRDADEYQRQFTLENVGLAAAATATLSFAYGFLENAGYPRLSMFAVWEVLAGCTALLMFVRSRAAR